MMDLVTDVYNKLHTRDELVFCPSCRRILYIPDDLPPELAIKARPKPKAAAPAETASAESAPGESASAEPAPAEPSPQGGTEQQQPASQEQDAEQPTGG